MNEHFKLTKSAEGSRGWDGKGTLSITSRWLMADKRALDLTTRKNDGGALVSTASVCRLDGGFEVHAVGWNGEGDFYQRIMLTPGRATEKALRHEHAGALARMIALGTFDAVAHHYATQAAELAAKESA